MLVTCTCICTCSVFIHLHTTCIYMYLHVHSCVILCYHVFYPAPTRSSALGLGRRWHSCSPRCPSWCTVRMPSLPHSLTSPHHHYRVPILTHHMTQLQCWVQSHYMTVTSLIVVLIMWQRWQEGESKVSSMYSTVQSQLISINNSHPWYIHVHVHLYIMGFIRFLWVLCKLHVDSIYWHCYEYNSQTTPKQLTGNK